MQTKTYTIYEYDELTPEAQEKAREWWIQNDDLPLLNEYMHETAHGLLTEAGFTDIDIEDVYYSLSHCQSDGAMIAFSATYDGASVGVRQYGRYYHEHSTIIEMIKDVDGVEEECDTKDLEENVLVPLFKKLRDAGYAFIEAEREPENVAENIKINEYTFLEDGTRSD